MRTDSDSMEQEYLQLLRHVLAHGVRKRDRTGTGALVEEGDSVTIDMEQRLLRLNVPDEEIARRRKAWQPFPLRYTRGVLAKYVKLVSSASKGAVTD